MHKLIPNTKQGTKRGITLIPRTPKTLKPLNPKTLKQKTKSVDAFSPGLSYKPGLKVLVLDSLEAAHVDTLQSRLVTGPGLKV
jgi:hypothetical protein